MSSIPKLPILPSVSSSRNEGATSVRLSRAGATERHIGGPQTSRFKPVKFAKAMVNEESSWKFFDKEFNLQRGLIQQKVVATLPPLPQPTLSDPPVGVPKLLDTPVGAAEGLERILAQGSQKKFPQIDRSSRHSTQITPTTAEGWSDFSRKLLKVQHKQEIGSVGPRITTDQARIVPVPPEKLRTALVKGTPIVYKSGTSVAVTDKLAKSQRAVPFSPSLIETHAPVERRQQSTLKESAESASVVATRQSAPASPPGSFKSPSSRKATEIDDLEKPTSAETDYNMSFDTTLDKMPACQSESVTPSAARLAQALANRGRLVGELSGCELQRTSNVEIIKQMPRGFGAVRHNPPVLRPVLRDIRAPVSDVPDVMDEAAFGRLHIPGRLRDNFHQVPAAIMGVGLSGGLTPPSSEEEDLEELLTSPMQALEKLVYSCIDTLCDFAPLGPEEEGYAEEALETMAEIRSIYAKRHPLSELRLASSIPACMIDQTLSVQKGTSLVRIEHQEIAASARPNPAHLKPVDVVTVKNGYGGPLFDDDLPKDREEKLAYLREKQREAEIHFGLRVDI